MLDSKAPASKDSAEHARVIEAAASEAPQEGFNPNERSSMRSSETQGYQAFDFIYFQVLRTCRELGLDALFERCRDRELSADEIRRGLELPHHSVRVLLMAACAFGLVRRDPQTSCYRAAGVLGDSHEGLPVDFDWIRRVYLPSWSHLTESLRRGTNAGLSVLPGAGDTLYERLAMHPELEAAFAQARGLTVSNRRLPLLLDALETLPEFRHVLDVGGGDGTTARGIAARFGHARVTVFDLPTVVELGRAPGGHRHDANDRVHLFGGDVFAGDWPSGADCVLFSAFLEIFSEDLVRLALRRAHAELLPGGHVIINQTVCDEGETGPLWPAVLSLYFANLASGSGMTYPCGDFERWCSDAGFNSFRVHRAAGSDACVMIAAKER